MKEKLFVVLLFAVVFQTSKFPISVAQETSSVEPKCKRTICPKIVCTGGTKPVVDSNGCPECPICLQKPICESVICKPVECPFGETSQPTVLPNKCPGCPKCVKCKPLPYRCPPINCINPKPTTLPNGCRGCPHCERRE